MSALKVERLCVYLLAFWSGCFVMALELLGARALGPFFGSGIYVWGAVITLFMLSLSLGYLMGGSLSARDPSLARLAALVLLAMAAALPCALAQERILELVAAHVEDVRYGALAGSVALFFLPITVSGAVSPYAVRLLVQRLGSVGQVAGWVFFVSTLGSTLGTLATSFYLVLMFDLDQIMAGLLAASAAFGLASLLVARARSGDVATA
jgi:hypothetical protein